MRDHGGNIDSAMAQFGGAAADWIDLSTGINRQPYPVPDLPISAWTMLPTHTANDALLAAVRAHYQTTAPVLAIAGAQAAIQMIPWLAQPGPHRRARVLGPTYNEHAASLRAAGWHVTEVSRLDDLAGAELAVVVNPNNPDGQTHTPADLLAMVARVGRLVVDESFADIRPDVTMLPHAGMDKLLILRSFGKFWGLAGARLGFVFGPQGDITALAAGAGPWPVSGAALDVGLQAYSNIPWANQTRQRLQAEIPQIDALALSAGWTLAGGTALFRLYHTPDAKAAQTHLARAHIWSRLFPWHENWLRLGLPGSALEWHRLADATTKIAKHRSDIR